MPDRLGIRVDGLKELDAAFEEMWDPKRVNLISRKALRTGALIVQKAIQERAPFRPNLPSGTALPPGALSHDIVISARRSRAGSPYSIIGPGELTKHIARFVEYGHRIVRGGRYSVNKKSGRVSGTGKILGSVPPHPFIRPGYEASAQAAKEAMMDSLLDDATRPARQFTKKR